MVTIPTPSGADVVEYWEWFIGLNDGWNRIFCGAAWGMIVACWARMSALFWCGGNGWLGGVPVVAWA